MFWKITYSCRFFALAMSNCLTSLRNHLFFLSPCIIETSLCSVGLHTCFKSSHIFWRKLSILFSLTERTFYISFLVFHCRSKSQHFFQFTLWRSIFFFFMRLFHWPMSNSISRDSPEFNRLIWSTATYGGSRAGTWSGHEVNFIMNYWL